jgi:spore germination cell wall hydrolase CwlJ-like protein
MRLFTFAATVCMTLYLSSAAVAGGCDEQKQKKLLALNMYHEARGEGVAGMQMVGEVTLNRVNRPEFPDTICAVIYQRSQFSWVRGKKNHHPGEKESWELALEIADDLLQGEANLYDNGATHFMASSLLKNPPKWARNFGHVATLGKHTFYEMPPRG